MKIINWLADHISGHVFATIMTVISWVVIVALAHLIGAVIFA